MDYEKKYKEALERAKSIHSFSSDLSEIKRMEQIFPELVKTEEERIRQNCIHFLELQKSHHAATFEIEECIAWLEKQTPVKFNNEKDEKIGKELLESFKYQQRESRTDKEWLNGIKLSEVVSWLEKQGQKFQYWEPSEEQLEALDYAYNSCPDTERGNYYEGVLETLIDDLHKLSEKQGETSPVLSNSLNIGKNEGKISPKWSKEDEEEFKIAIETLHEAGQHSSAMWLKSIKQRLEEQ